MRRLIDISHHNIITDWNKIAKEYDGVIIRTSYGVNATWDKKASEHVDKCSRYNIPYAFYHYSYAYSKEEAQKEAQNFADIINGFYSNIPFFVALDMEDADGKKEAHNCLNRESIRGITETFINTLRSYLREDIPIALYANQSWYNTYGLQDYNVLRWVARWNENEAPEINAPFEIWQKSSKHFESASAGNLDLNIISPAVYDMLMEKKKRIENNTDFEIVYQDENVLVGRF